MINCLFVVHEPQRFCEAAKTKNTRARDEAGTGGKGTRTGTADRPAPGIKRGSGAAGSPMMRPGRPQASICPNSKSYYHQSAERGFVSGALFPTALVFTADSKSDM